MFIGTGIVIVFIEICFQSFKKVIRLADFRSKGRLFQDLEMWYFGLDLSFIRWKLNDENRDDWKYSSSTCTIVTKLEN